MVTKINLLPLVFTMHISSSYMHTKITSVEFKKEHGAVFSSQAHAVGEMNAKAEAHLCIL